jgi:GNAT superfamily N-acetyltransferase
VTAAVSAGEAAIREMTPADVAGALRLSRAAGWNQTEADWLFLIGENPGRFVVAERGGVVVGTGGAACYGKRLAWVCMILVDAAARGHGLGSAIVSSVLDRVGDMQVLGLDATPSGRPVYERLGFVAASGLARVGGSVKDGAGEGRVETRPVDARDLETIVGLDPEAFGADRSRALRWAHSRAPALSWCAIAHGAIVGYCFGRQGERAVHVGPVVAPDAATARALVARAAAAAGGRDVILDVPVAAADWTAALQESGLREQRPFTRMYRAGARPPGGADLVFAAFGPELG